MVHGILLARVPRLEIEVLVQDVFLQTLWADVSGLAERYERWKPEPVNAYAEIEVELNSLGYELMAAGRPDLSIEIFTLNVAEHPRSANAYDSLGESMALGDRELAIRGYERALELDPTLFTAAESLENLCPK